MCDYSLQHVATRAAKVDDLLVSTKFNNSITRGFAEVGEPNVAVCILPGTELAFERDVEYDHARSSRSVSCTSELRGSDRSTWTTVSNTMTRWSSRAGR